MIILQILLIPLVIFTMLGFVFVISFAGTGLPNSLEDTDQLESRAEESNPSCATNTSIPFSTSSGR
jgi:hypothetical protein